MVRMDNDPPKDPARADLAQTQPTTPNLEQTQPHRASSEEQAVTQEVRLGLESPPANLPAPVLPPIQEAGNLSPKDDEEEPPRRPWRWLMFALLGLFLLLGIAVVSGYGGYLSAIDLRLDNQ